MCSNARVFVRTCIRTLFPVLGENWNSDWNAAGFTGGSLAIPANPRTLLQQMRSYYIANPTRECTVQGVACTAAACEATAQAISAAESASNQSNTDSGEAQKHYLTGMANGRARLTGLRNELTQLIEDDDDRWYAFGFDKPSDPATPEVPANLTLVAGAPASKTAIADWDDARRADSYRVRAVNKVTNAQLLNEIAHDSQFTITPPGVASGTIITVTISARNAAGESPASDPVDIALP